MWLDRLENEPFLPATWLRHQHRDAYWQHGSGCEDFSRIKAATLAIGGWGDAYKNAVPWKPEELRPPRHVRRVEQDLQAGTTTLVIEDDFGAFRDTGHGLITGSVARERWTIQPDDPLSARGETHWTQTLARDGWSIRTETFADMWSDATTFHLRGRIEAYESGRRVFERDFTDAIPRDHL
ncbi:MAG: CocE/NonD family hydrolase [Minwuia sp.]|nr:CocE/NonD family hydrolase [Minwuia sp.]